MKNLLTLVLSALAVAACSAAPVPGGHASPPAGSAEQAEVTAAPPRVPLESLQPPLPEEGWQTYTSTQLGISVDYPAGWSASEGAGSVTFASPDGATVLLETVPAGASAQECTRLVNSFSQAADVCADGSSGQYTATFSLVLAGGSTLQVRLSTVGPQALVVYRLMVNSLRPAQ